MTPEKAARTTEALPTPWRPDPPPSPYLDDKTIVHATSDDDCFRHFFQLDIQHIYLSVEEVALVVSFNSHSQTPDIPDISTRDAMMEYTLSLDATQNDPDISSFSLHVLK